MTDRDPDVVTTARLLVRPPREADRNHRGLGYATEATQALLAKAHRTYVGEVLAIIAPENLTSQKVCRKLGFTFWKRVPVEGALRNLYTLPIGKPRP